MTEPKQRRLPPLSPSLASTETTEEAGISPRRPRKKKRPVENGREVPDSQRNAESRSSSRRRGADTVPSSNANVDPNPRPKTAKKKKEVGTSRETLVQSSDADGLVSWGENAAQPNPVKKKKKKRKKPQEAVEEDNYGFGPELYGIQDDIVDSQKEGEVETPSEPVNIGVPSMRSEPSNHVFIERKSGFKSKDKVKLAKLLAEQQLRTMEVPEESPSKTTIQFALATHKVFRTIAIFLQGLLAGFALWHIVTVWVTLAYSGSQTFLQVYQVMALPVQSLYYFLFVFATIAVFDRYDLACPNRRFVRRAFTLQNGAVSAFIYFLAMVFSVSTAALDDKIGLYDTQPDLWADPQKRDKELLTWKILSLIRGVLAILGWLVIAIKPTTDRLTKNLEKADDSIYDEQQPAMPSSGV